MVRNCIYLLIFLEFNLNLIILINNECNYFSYYVCATPNVYCKGTAIKLWDGIIVSKKPHSHGPNDDNFQSNEIKKHFRTALVNRAKAETNSLKSIYDEESIR